VLVVSLCIVSGEAMATEVTIPVQIGLGPTLVGVTGPVQRSQRFFGGAKVEVAAILDQQIIQQNLHRVPSRYRAMARGIEEARFSPSVFIPDTLYLSPPVRRAQMWGATWRPIGLSITPLRRPLRTTIGVGAVLTYLYFDSRAPGLEVRRMHFLRPGASLRAELEAPLAERVFVTLGWDSMVHLPQALESGLGGLGEAGHQMWHLGHAFVVLGFRFPYQTSL